MEDVFNQACLNGDLATAGELLDVLTKMHERRKIAFGRDRRINDDTILRARAELERRQRVRDLPLPVRAN